MAPVGDEYHGADPRFHDLGPLLVEHAGRTQPPPGDVLGAALALLLIHAGHRVGSDALAQAMWGDAATGRSTSTLDSHVWRLRRFLEPDRGRRSRSSLLVLDAGGYRLDVDPDRVDSLHFAELAVRARGALTAGQPGRVLELADEALGLWRGRPYSPVSNERWAQPAVARLEELHGQVRELRIDALLATGDPERALLALADLLATEPLRERGWAQRMLAHHQLGHTDRALAAYQRVRELMLDELGLEPGAELRELHGRLLAGTPAPDARPAAASGTREPEVHLPSWRTRLIGRDADVDRAAGMLRTRRLVTVVGVAGCGKTRLAVETARRMSSAFADGAWFVDLAGAQSGDQVLDAVASTLGVAAGGSGQAAVHRAAAGRQILLLLDNCEHVLDAAAALAEDLLGREDAGLTVLATSREPLAVDGEAVLALEPLAVTASSGSPAVEVFLDRLAAGSGGEPDDRERFRLASAICVAVDGVPLAIELAAARARSYSLAEIAAQVNADPSALARIGRGGNHHRSVRLAVDTSYRDLPFEEAALHRAVAVVPGPFTATLAGALVDPDLTDHPTGDALAALVHRSLLAPQGPVRPGGPSRFAQLAIVRGHASHVGAAETEQLHDRRDDHVRGLIDTKPRLGRSEEARWFAALDDDLPALRATLQRGLGADPTAAGVVVASRLGLYWYYRGMAVEGVRWLRRASGAGHLVSTTDRCTLELTLGGHLLLGGRVDPARPHIEPWFDALPTDDTEDDVFLGENVGVLLGPLASAGAVELVARCTTVVRELADRTGDPTLQLMAETGALLTDRFDGHAERVAEDAHALADRAQDLDNNYLAWMVAATAGLAELTLGRPAATLAWSDRMLRDHLRHGVHEAPTALELRGAALALSGDAVEALRVFGAAQAHCRRAGLSWPDHPVTTDLVSRARAALPAADAERAWRAGAGITLADLAGQARTAN